MKPLDPFVLGKGLGMLNTAIRIEKSPYILIFFISRYYYKQ